jgi:hypothetical protein
MFSSYSMDTPMLPSVGPATATLSQDVDDRQSRFDHFFCRFFLETDRGSRYASSEPGIRGPWPHSSVTKKGNPLISVDPSGRLVRGYGRSLPLFVSLCWGIKMEKDATYWGPIIFGGFRFIKGFAGWTSGS